MTSKEIAEKCCHQQYNGGYKGVICHAGMTALVEAIDAAILDAAREQAIADCKSVCSLCGTVVFSGDRHFTDEGIDLCCDALGIRAAWLRAHGTPLEGV